MAHRLTVEAIVPFVVALAPGQQFRLLRLIIQLPSDDRRLYARIPPAHEEFAVQEDPLSWGSEGWENVP